MAKVQLEAVLKLIDVQVNPQVFRRISQAVAGMPGPLLQVNNHIKNITNNTSRMNSGLRQTGQQLTQNERAARLFLQRMAQFAILLPTFATLNRAIQGSVQFLFEFDSALRDIVRVDVSGLAGRMEEIGDAALKTAMDFGVLAQEVLETTKIFVQAGLTIEDAQERARLAILATQVSTLTSADAIEFFIAAANQFKLSNDQLADSLDALVKVEDLAAVEAQDIAEAFRTGGNSLAEFGKDINEAIGLISALREQTRKSGREIGTFFKTLQTRIFAAGESRDALEALGVTVENLDGSLRPTLDVLNDMKAAFDGLTEAQTANAAKAIGGVRQFESLIATLNSLERANELSEAASHAAGTADLKRTITDEKLERQLGKLIAQGQAFAEALGDAGLEDALSGVLKIATKLLGLFTSLVDAIGEMGGNLTPLLALAGVRIGGSVLGLAGGGRGGGGAPAPGQANFIGPLQKAQQSLVPSLVAMKDKVIAGTQVIVSSGKALGQFAFQLATGTTVSKANGVQLGVNTTALKANAAAVAASTGAALKNFVSLEANKQALVGSKIGLIGLTLAASSLPKVFGIAEEKVRSFGDGASEGATYAAESAAQFTGIAGEGASLAAQFAVLGGEAMVIAGIFGLLKGTATRFFDAWEDRIKAIEEEGQLSSRAGRISGGEFRLSGGGRLGADAQAEFIKNFTTEIQKAKPGESLAANLQAALDQTANAQSFRDLKISSDELRESLFKSPAVIKAIVDANEGYFASLAEAEGGTEHFSELQEGLAEDSLTAGQAVGLLASSIRDGGSQIDELTGKMQRILSLEEFSAAQDILDLADGIRTLGRELEIAKLGPEAMSDELVRLQTEFLILQESSERTQKSLNEMLSETITSFGNQPGVKQMGIGIMSDLLRVPETFDTQAIEEFKQKIRSLPKAAQEDAERILQIVEKQTQDKLALIKAENDMLDEQNRRKKAMLEAEAQATQNAFEASRKFSAELMKFGDAVNTDVLAAFQNLTLLDVDEVLAGTSKLSEGLQQTIKSAFADPVTRAEQDLIATTASTQAELEILASRLELVKQKLEDEANAGNKSALVAEQRSLELAIETTKQSGAVSATEAKIKVLEAEKEAAEDAAEKEKKRKEALEKLADASRDFDKEIRNINNSFDEFMKQKIEDLLGREADAREELKSAQQEVLNSTIELADAYDALIKAQFEYNGVLAEAQLKGGMLANDIAKLTGAIFTFDGELNAISNTFNEVLNNANISLEKRIELEQRLAEDTLAFLQQAQAEIIQAGIGVFGQTGAENQALGQGIAGLQFIAEQLGGSFEAFLNMTETDFANVSQTLLNLPAEFRQQILDALSFLPSTMNIGGFSVDQLMQAIGQVGAGVAPEAGLPSLEELTNQQVEQLTRLQELALQDAQLQYSQVIAAQEQLAAAQEAADAAEIIQERAEQNLMEVRDAVLEEKAVLDAANQQRTELLNAVMATDDKNTLMLIEKEAEAFADQNAVFREVGDTIVKGIASAIGGKLAVLEAAANVKDMAKGYIPNLAGGNLSPDEAAALLRAGSREKRQMPAGAGLAVANTSEAVIPMRHRGFVPNFQDGNISSISAGISAIKQINETVVAAIAQSVTEALAGLEGGGGQTSELLSEVIAELRDISDTLESVEESNTQIQTNTTSDTGATTTPTAGANDVRITLETNQRNTITILGLEDLREQIAAAVREAAAEQVDEQLAALLAELDSIITALQERGLLSSFGQPR